MSIQDRTSEFHTLTSTAHKRLNRNNPSSAHQRLLQQHQQQQNGSDGGGGGGGGKGQAPRGGRGEFAQRAAEIGRAITGTMGKLERLAMLAKRKALFDDKPVEIAELTYIIKQDLSSINTQISSLQALTRQSNPSSSKGGSEVGEHSKNVVVMLQGKLADVSVGFKEVLEVRTKNIQASRNRTDHFVSSVRNTSADHHSGALIQGKSDSPLYSTPSTTPRPGPSTDLLSLDPNPPSQFQSAQQLALMEEGSSSNSYISARSEAIEAIEKTIMELGGIFGQLAQMVGDQRDMIQRIDHETEDVVTNIDGGQRELLKYWGRVSSNRWLVIKMFGVLMIFFLLWVLIS